MTPLPAHEPVEIRIQTRFGEFTVPSPHVVRFPDGIPGFEVCQRFVLIAADALTPLSCLQGLEAPFPSFLAADPANLRADYRPVLGTADRAKLGVKDADTVLWLVLLTVGLHEVTANLKAPIAVNPATMVGRQVVLEADIPVCWPIETH
jgi:flagellar assembly factor FliW